MSQHLSRRAVALRPFQRQYLLRPHISVRHIANRDREPSDNFQAPDTLREKAQMLDPKQLDKSDFGLFPGTFVRSWAATPPLLPQPLSPISLSRVKQTLAGRYKYEKKWLGARLRDFWAMANYYFIRGFYPGFWNQKPQSTFGHSRTFARADELYEKVNHAFSSKDTSDIKDLTTEGLLANIQTRLSGRPKSVTMAWKITHRDRWPFTRVVSNRFTYLPIPNADDTLRPSAIRQLVLRKSTTQSLTIDRARDVYASAGVGAAAGTKTRKRRLAWRPDGVREERVPVKEAVVEEEEEEVDVERNEKYEKKVVEYMVLQKVMVHGVEKPWRLWGFTEPTTLESLEAAERKEDERAELENKESALGA